VNVEACATYTVAVLLHGGCRLSGDEAAGAGPVEHDDLLFPDLGEAIGDDARRHVRAVTGRGGCDERDRFGGIFLRMCRQARHHGDGGNTHRAESQLSHPHWPLLENRTSHARVRPLIRTETPTGPQHSRTF
jgi:hypothetical protein